MNRLFISSFDKGKGNEVREVFTELCKNRGFQIVDENPDFVVSIGGDGTMLRTIREYIDLNVPFIGINAGRLGFLPDFNCDRSSLERLLEILKSGVYRTIPRPLLDVETIDVEGRCYRNFAFNEVVVKFSNMKMMDIDIAISGKHFNHFTGDGLVISTPLGSTGYAIWAGAAAINPELPCFQLTPINPNNASIRNPLIYPLVLPERDNLSLTIVNREDTDVIVALDGNSYHSELFAEVKIGISDCKVHTIESLDYDYWHIVKSKLLDKNLKETD